MMFWDSSALVPLVVEEAQSKIMTEILEQDGQIAVWAISFIEVQAAVGRKRRENKLNSPQRRKALELLSDLEKRWSEIGLSDSLKRRAGRHVEVHPIRTGDALQLAAAEEARGESEAVDTMVCLDSRLRSVAEREGFRLLPEKIKD